MGWHEIGALAALAGMLVVLGSVAAAMSEYMKTIDFNDPAMLEKALSVRSASD